MERSAADQYSSLTSDWATLRLNGVNHESKAIRIGELLLKLSFLFAFDLSEGQYRHIVGVNLALIFLFFWRSVINDLTKIIIPVYVASFMRALRRYTQHQH